MDWEDEGDYAGPSTPSKESEPDTISAQLKKLVPSAERAIYYELARNRPHINRA